MQNFSKTQEFTKKIIGKSTKTSIFRQIRYPPFAGKLCEKKPEQRYLFVSTNLVRLEPGKFLVKAREVSHIRNAKCRKTVFSLSLSFFLEFPISWVLPALIFFRVRTKKSLYYIQCPSMNLKLTWLTKFPALGDGLRRLCGCRSWRWACYKTAALVMVLENCFKTCRKLRLLNKNLLTWLKSGHKKYSLHLT